MDGGSCQHEASSPDVVVTSRTVDATFCAIEGQELPSIQNRSAELSPTTRSIRDADSVTRLEDWTI